MRIGYWIASIILEIITVFAWRLQKKGLFDFPQPVFATWKLVTLSIACVLFLLFGNYLLYRKLENAVLWKFLGVRCGVYGIVGLIGWFI